jgi:hypothetical protein
LRGPDAKPAAPHARNQPDDCGSARPPAAEDRHAAVCTVARIEYLVSWNFKHLANVRRESGFNAVNLLQGCRYPSLRIVAPTFLIHGHDQEKDL